MRKYFYSCSKFVMTMLVAFAIAGCFRSLVFEPFHIPSGSMKDTLLIGDYVFVSKYTYGYSRYSFPFSPQFIKGRILGNTPERGDVIVFRNPKTPDVSYVKRVIGLPNDNIQLIDGALYINGRQVAYPDSGKIIDEDTGNSVNWYMERLPNGRVYRILDEVPSSPLNNTPVYTVPAGSIFVMGDNRDNSRDSRFISDVGFVPLENIVGKVQIVMLSFKHDDGSIFGYSLRGDRVLHRIK